jgi:tRNA(Ile2) C34 agmatinyltransferase TiaS
MPKPRCPRCRTALDEGPIQFRCARCRRAVYAADLENEYVPRTVAITGAAA